MSTSLFAALTDSRSNGYGIMLFIHIISIVAAFGPALVYPSLLTTNPQVVARIHQRITIPGLVVSGIIGNGLVGMSEKTFTHAQLWVSLSNTLWIVAVILAVFPMRKIFAKLAADPQPALAKRAMAFIGPYHLIFAALGLLMIFKPGA
jgi:hypothetical protein